MFHCNTFTKIRERDQFGSGDYPENLIYFLGLCLNQTSVKTKFLRSLLAAFLLLAFFSLKNVSAQIIEITPVAGYTLGGKFKNYYGEFRIDNAMAYGGKLAFGLSTTTFVEVSYTRVDTEGQYFSYSGSEAPGDKYPISSNYIQIGGLQEMDMGVFSPFFTVTGGLAVWGSSSPALSSYTQLSFTFGGGTKIWITDNIGIRLQASMLMPLVWRGGGFGCGTGGCSTGIYTRITPFQGEFLGGLIIKLKPGR